MAAEIQEQDGNTATAATGNGKPTTPKPARTCPPDAQFYRVADLARMLQVSRETIHRMVRDQRLAPPTYIGVRSPRWSRPEIDRWITAGCPPSTEAQQRLDAALAKARATRRANQERANKRLRDILNAM